MLSITSASRPVTKMGQIHYDAYFRPLIKKLPSTSCEICVIVPVRNEAENIEATLLALTNQVDLEGRLLDKKRYEIIVLANNCSDNSADIVRRFAKNRPDLALHLAEITLEGDRAHIGWVRKILMDEAYRRLSSLGRDSGIIASTDGDTIVSDTWIAATIEEINSGVDAVGGRIITERRERLLLDRKTRLYFLRYVGYLYLTARLETYVNFDPVELRSRHHQHYGASFAVTAQIYARVGGIPPLPSLEDVALYEALKRVDARFRHSPKVKVTTSARAIGRAKAGLSDRLSQLKIMAQNDRSMLVESAELLKVRFTIHRWLRYLRNEVQQGKTYFSELAIIASTLNISVKLLEKLILRSRQSNSTSQPPAFGLLLEQIKLYQEDDSNLDLSWQKVPIKQANADLRSIIREIERNSNSSKLHSAYLSLNALEQIEPIRLFAKSL